jgi:hypothetical protein
MRLPSQSRVSNWIQPAIAFSPFVPDIMFLLIKIKVFLIAGVLITTDLSASEEEDK